MTVKANPVGAFLGDSDTQNVTGSKTYLDSTLKYRNRAGTASMTIRGPIITSDAESLLNDEYDFLIFVDTDDGNKIKAKQGKSQAILFQDNTDTGIVLNALLSSLPATGGKVSFLPGTYTGSTQHLNNSKKRVQYVGNGAVISGFTIKLLGNALSTNVEKCSFKGFTFSGTSAGLVFDSAFAPSVEQCNFDGCTAGISIESSVSWTEFFNTKNCYFDDCIKAIVFKTPTGTGTGSYVNSRLDDTTFNSTDLFASNYTFIEIQSGAQVNEGKWINQRFWFNGTGVLGIGIDLAGDATRLQLHKPYFENFSSATNTTGIIIRTTSGGGLFLQGRPIFAGAGTWTAKFSNAFNKFIHGPVESWRQTHTITPSATINTYGTAVDCLTGADWGGVPNIYLTIGGTVATGETVTVEITGSTYSAFAPVLTKTYTAVGTFALTHADYLTLLSNNFFYVTEKFSVRAKSSIATTAATVTFGGFEGGISPRQLNNSEYSFLIIKDAADSNRLKAINAKTAEVVQTHATDLGILLNNLLGSLTDGDTISFQSASYSMATQYLHTAKRHITFIGNGSTISGSTIKLNGLADSLTVGYCIFKGFNFSGASAGLIFDNTFNVKVQDCTFDTCAVGISIESSANWTELWKIENTHFNDCTKSIVFKTPTSTGTGSYINGEMDHVTFNSFSIAVPYTFIEVQASAQINEGKWTNSRLWFNSTAGTGTGMDISGTSARCKLIQPYFENFGTATNTTGIKLNVGCTAPQFVGRPIFAGAGTWTAKITNASNIHLHGQMAAWRQSHTITPSATANTYGTAVTCLTGEDWQNIPNIYVVTGGTFAAAETITVEIVLTTYSAFTATVTKTYTNTGTFPLALADYLSFLSNNYYTIIESFSVRAKSSATSTTATVSFIGFSGGTAVTNDTIAVTSTLGDIAYRNATTNTRLAGNTTAAKQFLNQTGTGSVSAAPAWAALVDADLPAAQAGKTFTTSTLTAPTITDPVVTTTIGTLTAFPSEDPSFSRKKWGRYTAAGTSQSDGILGANATAIAVGTGASGGIIRASTGQGWRHTTGTTVNSIGGVRFSAQLLHERDLNPWAQIRMKINQTTNTRCFFGFTSSNAAPASGADQLNALSGVMFGYDSGVDGNWHIYQNDGVGGSDSTTIANVAAAGTGIHTFALRADNTNSKFQYSYDGGAWADINTTIPAASTGLGLTFFIENLGVGVASTMDVYYMDMVQDL